MSEAFAGCIGMRSPKVGNWRSEVGILRGPGQLGSPEERRLSRCASKDMFNPQWCERHRRAFFETRPAGDSTRWAAVGIGFRLDQVAREREDLDLKVLYE